MSKEDIAEDRADVERKLGDPNVIDSDEQHLVMLSPSPLPFSALRPVSESRFRSDISTFYLYFTHKLNESPALNWLEGDSSFYILSCTNSPTDV